jgi:hypothetical protein
MTLPVVQAAMADLRAAHRDLLRTVDSLTEADWQRYVPYGEWTVKDLVAHCIGDMSPAGIGLVLAGVLTPEFIRGTAQSFDIRARNAALVAERKEFSREDLRQMLFSCRDAMYVAALKLDEEHLPTLALPVPVGPEYDLRVEDWLWAGYHDRQHADDIRRALTMDWRPEGLTFLPEIDAKLGALQRRREGVLRAVYSVAEDAWDEEAEADPGWTYKDLLVHIATNDLRHHIRLRNVLGEGDAAALESLLDVDGWNERERQARRERSLAEVIDEMAANRQELLRLLARLEPAHLASEIFIRDGMIVKAGDYVEVIGAHESRHGGQLVPASRAARQRA